MEKKVIIPEGTDASRLPFSPAIQADKLVFLSGNAGIGKDGKIPGPDIVSQARQAMENLGEGLRAAGSSWDKVLKVNCFLTHAARDFAGWNQVWKEYFPKDPPARTTVGSSLLREEWLIEVDLIAYVD
ncbi:MAG: RidA family protein [Chloroflexi bacterium]|nr:RidA family protein [Chloroflexota bacterium]